MSLSSVLQSGIQLTRTKKMWDFEENRSWKLNGSLPSKTMVGSFNGSQGCLELPTVGLTRVFGQSQKVGMKTRLDGQSNVLSSSSVVHWALVWKTSLLLLTHLNLKAGWNHSHQLNMYPPFEKACQLNDTASEVSHSHSNERLPGQPLLRLQFNPEPLFNFLDLNICTRDLDRMAPYLWLVSTPSSSRISSLHYQKIKG